MSAQDERLVQYQPPEPQSKPWPQSTLHSIVPPLFTPEGVCFASTVNASRTDVVNLEQRLAAQLRQKQARASGLCPIRYELTLQCFNELIRQTYVNQADCGLLMARIRDEMQRIIAIYQSLYLDAQLETDADALHDQEDQVERLEAENEKMKRELAEVQAKLNQSEKLEVERRALLEKKHTEEQVFLRKQQIQLQSQWDNRQQQ